MLSLKEWWKMEFCNDYMLIGNDYEREQRILATYLENKEESLEKEKNKENSN
jgi:hypothetical protein